MTWYKAAGILLGLALVATFWARADARAQKEQTQTRAERQQLELETFEQRYEQAFNRRDLRGVANMYTEDAVLVSPTGQRADGRQQVMAQLRDDPGMSGELQIDFEIVDIHPISDELSMVTVHREYRNVPAGAQHALQGVTLLQRQGNQWRIRDARMFPARPLVQPGLGGAGEEGMPETPLDMPEDTQRRDEPGPYPEGLQIPDEPIPVR